MPKDKSLKPDIDEDLEIGQRLNWKVICVSSSFFTFQVFDLQDLPARLQGRRCGKDKMAPAEIKNEPTWRCHQNPFIGAFEIQEPVIPGEPLFKR